MNAAASLHVLCAGAVQGVVKALQERFEQEAGVSLQARFGAVGVLKEALLGGEPCDVMIVTDAMVQSLQATHELVADVRAPLGAVPTGLAVRSGEALPEIATQDSLRSTLLGASALYFPDPKRSTAGIHFAQVLQRLGLAEQMAGKVRNFPNGATSMRELAASGAGAIGCTQVTEILYTPGIVLVGPLPAGCELATVYSAGMAARAASPDLARRFVELLSGPASRSLRAAGGFEFS